MRSIRVSLILLMMLCSSFTTRAQSNGTTQWWEEALQTNDLPVISKIFKEGNVLWPIIDSKNNIEKLEIDARRHGEARLKLVDTLRKKIEEFEVTNQDTEKIVSVSLETYAPIRDALQHRGGYSNYVLVDAMNRLMLARICAYLVRNQGESKYAAALHETMMLKSITQLPVAELLHTELACTLTEDVLKNTPESQWMDKVFQAATGTNFTTFLVSMNTSKSDTRKLLQQRDLPMLIFRMAEVQMVYHAALPALIEFLKRGGSLDDINVRDISKFKQIMGDARGSYKCELLQTRKIYAHNLQSLIDSFSEGAIKSPLYQSVTGWQ